MQTLEIAPIGTPSLALSFPVEQPFTTAEQLLAEIDFQGTVPHLGQAVASDLPRNMKQLEEMLVLGARGGCAAMNADRAQTKRLTFFIEPGRRFVLGLSTYRNSRGEINVTSPRREAQRAESLEKLLRAEYLPVASIRLRDTRRASRIQLSRADFDAFLAEAKLRQHRWLSRIEQNRVALEAASSNTAAFEPRFDFPEEESEEDISPEFLYALFDHIEGHNRCNLIRRDDVQFALEGMAKSSTGRALAREALIGRPAKWVWSLTSAAADLYEETRTIKDSLKRADTWVRRMRGSRIHDLVERLPATAECGPVTGRIPVVDLSGREGRAAVTVQPRRQGPKQPSPSELRARAEKELAASPEYQVWAAARLTGPVVTLTGAGPFLEFWSPLIIAVQMRLGAILREIPAEGPILEFYSA